VKAREVAITSLEGRTDILSVLF